jgi:hypothetical protein
VRAPVPWRHKDRAKILAEGVRQNGSSGLELPEDEVPWSMLWIFAGVALCNRMIRVCPAVLYDRYMRRRLNNAHEVLAQQARNYSKKDALCPEQRD